jgi:hypothetical protein
MLIVLGDLLLLTLFGLVVLAFLDEAGQRLLLPAAPAIGALTAAAVLHWPGTFVGTNIGLPVAFAAGALACRTRLRPLARNLRSCWRLLLVVTAIGVPALVVGLEPQTRAGGARVVQPTWNNDAYAYVSLTDYLQQHPATAHPEIPPDPPAYGYSRSHLHSGLRIGEEFVQAAVATATGNTPERTWYTVSASWLLVLPGAMVGAAALLGSSPITGAIAGLIAGISALSTGQLFNQNSASLLGMVVSPLALALLVARLCAFGPWQPPRWLVGLGITGLAASYSEYAPIFAAGLALLVMFRATVGLRATVVDAAGILGTGLLIAPLAWYRTVAALTAEYHVAGNYWVSPFLDVSPAVTLTRLSGVIGLNGRKPAAIGIALCLVAAALIVIGIVRSAAARRLLPFLVGSMLLLYAMGSVRRFPYGHQRAVEISLVLFLLAMSIGGESILRAERLRRSRRLRVLAAGLLAVITAAFCVTNVRTARVVGRSDLARVRTVDRSFYEALGWVRQVSVDRGSNVLVADSEFFQQLWVVYLMRNLDRVAFPLIYPAYTPGLGNRGLWDGRIRRYALVGARDFVDARGPVVVARNARYRLLDLSRGEALIAMPLSGFNYDTPKPDGYSLWMAAQGELLFIRTAGYPRTVLLLGRGEETLVPLPIQVKEAASSEARTLLATATGGIRLALSAGVQTDVVLLTDRVASPPESQLPPRSLFLSGIAAG